jgi:hypothetical protein
MTRYFKSDGDVRRHFAIQAQLGTTPDPPVDLWERIEEARRQAVKMRAKKSHPLSQPNLASLVIPEITPARKTYPIRVVEHLASVPDVRAPLMKTYRLKGAF